MSTSGSTNFSVTRDDIIKGALRLVGAISQGEVPTTEQTTEAAEALNMMIKSFMALGMPLWAVKRQNVTLVAATKSYSIGLSQTVNTPKPLKIYQAYRHNNTTNIDVPLQIVSRQEYEQLSGKTSSGPPNQLYYEPLNTTGTIYLYPAPDATTATNEVVTIIYQRPFEDFDASTDEPDFPQEWFEVIKYGLAVRLAGEYAVERFTRSSLKKEYESFLELAQGFNQEDVSIYFQPDQLSRTNRGR